MEQKSRVYVLTLPGDETRRSTLLSHLSQQGIDSELFFGIDGRKGLAPELEVLIDRPAAARNMRYTLSDGEFACALSHRAIYQRILDEGLDAALILEDDALIAPNLGNFLRAGGMFAAPMILLDYSRVSVSRLSGKPFRTFGRLWRVAVTPNFATGYIVSAAVARELLQRATPVRWVADWPGDIHDLRAYALSPRLVDHLPVGNALSHLATVRGVELSRKAAKSARRYLSGSYWKGYLRKRFSKRIDP